MSDVIGIKAALQTTAISKGSPLLLRIEGSTLTGREYAIVDVWKVAVDYDDWYLQQGSTLSCDGDVYVATYPEVQNLEKGLYYLRLGIASQVEGEHSDIAQVEGILYFEIQETPDVSKTEEVLVSEYVAISEARNREFLRGFGNQLGAPGMTEYRGLVFIKNCIVTARARLGQYEIIPFNGLEANDEINLVNSFLSETDIPLISNTEAVLARARNGQPTCVVHFPCIAAGSYEEAGNLISAEVDLLCTVLSVVRSSYPRVFLTFLQDLRVGQTYYQLNAPHYRGNLMPSSLVGSEPRDIVRYMNNSLNNGKLQLYLSLYLEARMEERLEFAYFRYWNLIEVIARGKKYSGQPATSWQGTPVLNRSGAPRSVAYTAEDQVLEYIRRDLRQHGIGDSTYAVGLQQGLISEQIPIWYRHRNCVVHGGGCFPDDPSFCDRTKSKYVNCWRANDEIVAAHGKRELFTDTYFKNLQALAQVMLSYELKT